MHAACFSMGFWAVRLRNYVARLTTGELAKHRLVSKHPRKLEVCAHMITSGLKSLEGMTTVEPVSISPSLCLLLVFNCIAELLG